MKLMKRSLSLLLCICLLIGALLCFTSCQKKEVTVDLSGYQLVYDSSYKNTFGAWIKHFGDTVSAVAGKTIKTGTSTAMVETEAEILVGDTSRPQTAELLGKIEGEGYAFGVVDGKIVVIGTTKLMTVVAVEAFRKACLAGEGATITVKETVVSNAPTVQITGSYSVLYNEEWDDTKNDGRGPNSEYDAENPDALDYGVVAAKQAHKALKAAIYTTSTSLELKTDKKEKTAREVLIGRLNRDASMSFIKSIGVEEYGVALYDQTVVVAGHNDNGLRQAITMFEDLISLGATTDENGKKLVVWPAELRMTATKDFGWTLDVPTPEGEGVELTGSVDVGEGSVELYYTGKGVNAEAFNAYCATLPEAGYVLLQENSIEGSIFRTYRNTSTKVLLYTAYADYKHAFSQGVTMYDKCIRLVIGKSDDVGNDYDKAIFSPGFSSYTKVTDTRVTAVRYDYGAADYVSGNCYVIQLEDGSFIVLDGGVGGKGEYKRLYNVLNDLHTQTFGSAPSKSNPINIAAWFLTHGHNDHYVTFVDMCKNYGQSLKMDLLIANNASDMECYNTSNPNLYVRNALSTIANYTQGSTKYLKVHTGMKLYLGNIEMEVLYTHEDIYPQTLERFNNTSTVIRTTMNNTDGSGNVQGTPANILWLGDLETKGSACLRAMYGSYLESDMVQVAHHGGSGCERELYELTKARIVLWPCSAANMKDRAGSSTAKIGTYKYVDYHLYNMATVEYHIACDAFNTTITFTKDGPDMSVGGKTGLYDAYDHATVVIGSKLGDAIVKMK